MLLPRLCWRAAAGCSPIAPCGRRSSRAGALFEERTDEFAFRVGATVGALAICHVGIGPRLRDQGVDRPLPWCRPVRDMGPASPVPCRGEKRTMVHLPVDAARQLPGHVVRKRIPGRPQTGLRHYPRISTRRGPRCRSAFWRSARPAAPGRYPAERPGYPTRFRHIECFDQTQQDRVIGPKTAVGENV